MRRYLAKATSPGNIWEGSVILKATNLVEAQGKFFDWLEKQTVYPHMWRLELTITELRPDEYETV